MIVSTETMQQKITIDNLLYASNDVTDTKAKEGIMTAIKGLLTDCLNLFGDEPEEDD